MPGRLSTGKHFPTIDRTADKKCLSSSDYDKYRAGTL